MLASHLTLVMVVTGLLLIGLALPLANRQVPPNRWYGIRLRSTLADEQIWYAVNEQCGRDMLVLGTTVLILTLSALMALPGWRPEWRALLVAPVLVGGLMAITSRASRHAAQLGRD